MYYNLCTSCQQPSSTCSCTKVKTDNVNYTGPSLPCTYIVTNDNMTAIVQKLNDAICFNLTSSTTTVAPTTSTTTTQNCLVWEANFIQTGTSKPTIYLVNSTLGEDYITIQYSGVGAYTLTFSGQNRSFDVINTIILTGASSIGNFIAEVFDSNTINIYTTDINGVPSNDILFYNSLAIKSCLSVPPTPTTTSTTSGAPTTTTTTLVPPTTTTTTTNLLVMAYPVIGTCCGGAITEYVVSGPPLSIGNVINSVSEGFLGGYEVVGSPVLAIPTITLYNAAVYSDCGQWSAFWGAFACV